VLALVLPKLALLLERKAIDIGFGTVVKNDYSGRRPEQVM
jgi:hypothetical protein